MLLGVQGHTQPWVSFHLASSVTGSFSGLAHPSPPIRLGWPAPGPQESPCPHLSSTRITAHTTTPGFVTEALESKLRSSSKVKTLNGAIAPAPG